MNKITDVIVQLMCKSCVFDWPFQHRITSYLQLTFAPMENNSNLFHN